MSEQEIARLKRQNKRMKKFLEKLGDEIGDSVRGSILNEEIQDLLDDIEKNKQANGCRKKKEPETMVFDGVEYVKSVQRNSCRDCVYYDSQHRLCEAPENAEFWGCKKKRIVWKKKGE